jgi:hypothetical protein
MRDSSPQFQAFFRQYQPPALIVWGKNDFIFTREGAATYPRDLKDVETHGFQTPLSTDPGGNSGIGLATAKRFVAEGAYVFITGRRQPELDGAVKSIAEYVSIIQGDVAKLADLDRIYSTIRAERLSGCSDRQRGRGSIAEEHFDT